MYTDEKKRLTPNISWSLKRSTIFFALMLVVAIGFFASGCTRDPELLRERWSYSDLRYLNAIDTESVNNELIAIYMRSEIKQIQIRLDFLDVYPDWPIDIYLLFDNSPGGSNSSPIKKLLLPGDYDWDILIHIASTGKNKIIDVSGGDVGYTDLKIIRDTFLDTVEISFDRDVLTQSKNFSLLLIVSYKEKSNAYDVIGPVRSDAPPPPAIPVILAFWDAFQSATPAQALRSWDGAHEGPDSSRHGLRHLIEAAELNNTPIRILGVNYPMALSSFEYLGVRGKIEKLNEYGLLIFDKNDVLEYGYAQYPVIGDSNAATENGMSKTVIMHLLDPALRNNMTAALIIGGSLQNSSWGSPEKTAPTLNYIVNHPWMRLIDQTTSNKKSYEEQSIRFDYQFLQTYNAIESNRLRELAWNSYYMLIDNDNTDMDRIRNNYTRQIGHILAAAQWANSPNPLSDCSIDIDWDGESECILATNEVFTTYELSGGYLAFAFILAEGNPHQIIGPSYQLSIGLSDPSSWNPNYGLFADPTHILGAFADQLKHWGAYDFQIETNMLNIYISDMAIRKSFMISDSAIKMQITSSIPLRRYQIPFILDPWAIYQPNWVNLYSVENKNGYWQLSVLDEITIQVHSNIDINATSFLTPWEAIQSPEDPNYDYTPGYFLPFPMTLLETNISDNINVWVKIIK